MPPDTLVALVGQRKAAELLGGISERTLERWRFEGCGPRFVRVGRRVMYEQSALADFVRRRSRTSTREAA